MDGNGTEGMENSAEGAAIDGRDTHWWISVILIDSAPIDFVSPRLE